MMGILIIKIAPFVCVDRHSPSYECVRCMEIPVGRLHFHPGKRNDVHRDYVKNGVIIHGWIHEHPAPFIEDAILLGPEDTWAPEVVELLKEAEEGCVCPGMYCIKCAARIQLGMPDDQVIQWTPLP